MRFFELRPNPRECVLRSSERAGLVCVCVWGSVAVVDPTKTHKIQQAGSRYHVSEWCLLPRLSLAAEWLRGEALVCFTLHTSASFAKACPQLSSHKAAKKQQKSLSVWSVWQRAGRLWIERPVWTRSAFGNEARGRKCHWIGSSCWVWETWF